MMLQSIGHFLPELVVVVMSDFSVTIKKLVADFMVSGALRSIIFCVEI